MNGQKWRICKFHFVFLCKQKTKKYQHLKHGVSNVGKYNFVSYRQRCMVIRTIAFSSLQHKLKQSCTGVDQSDVNFQSSRAGLPHPARVLTNQIVCFTVVSI